MMKFGLDYKRKTEVVTIEYTFGDRSWPVDWVKLGEERKGSCFWLEPIP